MLLVMVIIMLIFRGDLRQGHSIAHTIIPDVPSRWKVVVHGIAGGVHHGHGAPPMRHGSAVLVDVPRVVTLALTLARSRHGDDAFDAAVAALGGLTVHTGRSLGLLEVDEAGINSLLVEC